VAAAQFKHPVLLSASRPRLLLSGDLDKTTADLWRNLSEIADIVRAGDETGSEVAVDGVLFAGSFAGRAVDLQVCAQGFMDSVPDGLALLDDQDAIIWHNRILQEMAGSDEQLTGQLFFDVFGRRAVSPGVFAAPRAADSKNGHRSTWRLTNRRYVELSAARSGSAPSGTGDRPFVSVVLRDVTEQVLIRQKLEAIHQAGMKLGDLRPDEVALMSPEDRIDILKENILQLTEEILGFDTIEIRLLNPATGQLNPLLQEGMQEEAACRLLYAQEDGNGLTGYVAATGKSYLCRDTQAEPRYLRGAEDARCSLTVPLRLQDTVLGTFNVEGPGADTFDETDLDFLEHFGDVVAQALNQLQLLLAEKVTTAEENAVRLQRQAARPTDDILADATSILEKYIGHDPGVCEKLQRILSNVRQIRGCIGQVSASVPATSAYPSPRLSRPQRPALDGKRILVVDADDTVRDDAHKLLDPHGCLVETVGSGEQACQMMRSHTYDVVLADIRLPDMNGFDCFCALRQIDVHTPVIFMTGFGWDASHSIVKARQQGLKSVLYKPFRGEQLLTEIEQSVTMPPPIV